MSTGGAFGTSGPRRLCAGTGCDQAWPPALNVWPWPTPTIANLPQSARVICVRMRMVGVERPIRSLWFCKNIDVFAKPQMFFAKQRIDFPVPRIVFAETQMVFANPRIVFAKSQVVFGRILEAFGFFRIDSGETRIDFAGIRGVSAASHVGLAGERRGGAG